MPDPVPPHARMRIRRRFAHDPARVYAWLTDYDEEDPKRAGGVVTKRRVLSRSATRVTMEGELDVIGRAMPGTAEVDLEPPSAWHARFYLKGKTLAFWNDYRVAPDGNGGTLLEVDYHYRMPTLKRRILYHLAGKRRIRRDLDLMWNGFEAAMDRELAATAAAR